MSESANVGDDMTGDLVPPVEQQGAYHLTIQTLRHSVKETSSTFGPIAANGLAIFQMTVNNKSEFESGDGLKRDSEFWLRRDKNLGRMNLRDSMVALCGVFTPACLTAVRLGPGIGFFDAVEERAEVQPIIFFH